MLPTMNVSINFSSTKHKGSYMQLTNLKVEPDIEDGIQKIVEVQVQLSEPVERFCKSLDNNFEGTALRAEKLAAMMHQAAYSLEAKAKELREAGPDLSKQVRDWITYERETNENVKFFSSLFNIK